MSQRARPRLRPSPVEHILMQTPIPFPDAAQSHNVHPHLPPQDPPSLPAWSGKPPSTGSSPVCALCHQCRLPPSVCTRQTKSWRGACCPCILAVDPLSVFESLRSPEEGFFLYPHLAPSVVLRVCAQASVWTEISCTQPPPPWCGGPSWGPVLCKTPAGAVDGGRRWKSKGAQCLPCRRLSSGGERASSRRETWLCELGSQDTIEESHGPGAGVDVGTVTASLTDS